MFHYAYVLSSRSDKGIYIGFASDLKQRIEQHNAGKVYSTKNRRPLDLVYFEGHRSKRSAMMREKYLKSGWGRNYLNKILENPKI